MFIKYETEYNPKIDFKIIYSINSKLNLKKDYFNLKKIFNDKTLPETEQEKEFYKLLKVYRLFQNNQLAKKTISEGCEILKIKVPDEELIMEIINCFCHDKFNINNIYWTTYIFWLIMKKQIFKNYSGEMAVLIFNSLLSKNGYVPIVFTQEFMKFIEKQMKKHIDLESLLMLFSIYKGLSIKYLNKFETLTKEEIITILLKEEDNLKNKFNLEKLWLFGSFVRGEANKYSDVDLFIKTKSKIEANIINDLKKYLQQLFKRSVDIQVEGRYSSQFSDNPYHERELIF